jgi:hypothetical protein
VTGIACIAALPKVIAIFFASGMNASPLNARIHSDSEDHYRTSALDLYRHGFSAVGGEFWIGT